MKIPAGFGAGTATIVLKAEMNPSRTEHGDAQPRRSDGKRRRKPKPKPKQKLKKRSSAAGVHSKGAEDPLIAV